MVSGGAKGADTYGEALAALLGLPVARYLPDWGKHGKRAGPIRNREMAKNADALLCAWDGKSRGTKNMIVIETASRLNLLAYVHRYRAWG